MVAGIIHRAAPKALLMPLRAFDGDGNGNLFDIVRAIYWAVDHGAKVINMSFSLRVFSPELMRAVNYATRQGVACVASAGNESEEVMVYPAALGNTIGVAAVSQEDSVSAFSNFGDDLVSVAAPGEQIITSFPGGGWAAASGTSFAAPWVSGVAALFAQMRSYELSPVESSDAYMIGLAMAFRAKQDDKGPKRIGHGRLALKEALKFMQVVSGLK